MPKCLCQQVECHQEGARTGHYWKEFQYLKATIKKKKSSCTFQLNVIQIFDSWKGQHLQLILVNGSYEANIF